MKRFSHYDYMDDWEKFKETSIPDITDGDYSHTKRVCQDFEMKHLGEYHDLHVQSNTFLLADVFRILDI